MEILIYITASVFFLLIGIFLGYKCHLQIFDLVYSIKDRFSKEEEPELNRELFNIDKRAYFDYMNIQTPEQRLQRAIEQENYELANKIKNEMDKDG